MQNYESKEIKEWKQELKEFEKTRNLQFELPKL